MKDFILIKQSFLKSSDVKLSIRVFIYLFILVACDSEMCHLACKPSA